MLCFTYKLKFEHMKNYFTLDDFFKSDIAIQNNICNLPESPDVLANIAKLWKFLNYTRELLEAPIWINSAYRCKELNAIVPGSSKNSIHIEGLAADITTFPSKMDDLYEILSNIRLVELIKYDTFIHIAI